MIRNVLVSLDINYISDFAVNNSFFNSIIKRSISKHVAYHNLRVIFLCAVNKLSHFLLINCKRLFKKHIISAIKKRNGSFNMLFVHSTVNNCICKLTFFGKFIRIFKAHIFRKAKLFHTLLSSYRVRVSNADNFQKLRICKCKLTVNHCSVTCADDNSCYRFFIHINYLLSYFFILYTFD